MWRVCMVTFITTEDYIMIGASALEIVQQADTGNRENAEKEAIEEVAGYLRSRYDVDAIFTATGEARNNVIVMRCCDVALYHLASSRNQRQGMEIRKERYERAVKWLEDVQKGNVMPDLPTPVGPDGEQDINNPIRFGSERKNSYGW